MQDYFNVLHNIIDPKDDKWIHSEKVMQTDLQPPKAKLGSSVVKEKQHVKEQKQKFLTKALSHKNMMDRKFTESYSLGKQDNTITSVKTV